VDIHIMPDLPSSSVEKDEEMFDFLLDTPHLQADQWKVYPCEITPFTKIKEWYEQGTYSPYANTSISKKVKYKKSRKNEDCYEEETIQTNPLFELLVNVKSRVPPWIRLNRVIRDIPNQYIIAGNDVPNLRQALLCEMGKRGIMCRCIRCREVREKDIEKGDAVLIVRKYRSSGGWDHFISYEDQQEKVLYGFVRVRMCLNDAGKSRKRKKDDVVFQELVGCALIRELHVYGQVLSVKKNKKKKKKKKKEEEEEINENYDENKSSQHFGFGKRLLQAADWIATENGAKKIAVIAGVGVKEYYRKHGFIDEGVFVTKNN